MANKAPAVQVNEILSKLAVWIWQAHMISWPYSFALEKKGGNKA